MSKDPVSGWTIGCVWEGEGGQAGKMTMSQILNGFPAMFNFRFYNAGDGILGEPSRRII